MDEEHPIPQEIAARGSPGPRKDAKLTIKAGESEVTLEARPEVVRQELDRVLDRLLPAAPVAEDTVVAVAVPAPEPPAGAAGKNRVSQPAANVVETPVQSEGAREDPKETALDFVTRSRGRQLVSSAAARFLRHATLDPRNCAALYSVDPRGKVALRTLPPTRHRDRDALLLLLYGMLTLRGEWPVVGATLVSAARVSGIELERVPRKFVGGGELVTAFGRRRGKRYRLTAGGVVHCERLIPGLLKDLEN